MSYINSHDITKSDVYEYVKSKVDVEELVSYYLAQCFFDNSDLFKRNVGLWKEKDGKWRWIIYDLDFAYITYETKPVLYLNKNPYYNSSLDIIVKLYKNKEFKDLYLTSLAKYLKTTFKPSRINKIVDQMTKEVEEEMKYHIERWGDKYTYVYNWDRIPNMSSWKNNLNVLKNNMKKRYNDIVNNLQSGFKLSDAEYKKYFGDI